MGMANYQRWLVENRFCNSNRMIYRFYIVRIGNILNMPVIRLITLADILGESDSSRAIYRNSVVIVKSNELAKLQMSGQRSSLAGNSFLHTSIAHDYIGVMVNNISTLFIESRGQKLLGDGHPNSIRKTLPKRSGCHLDARCITAFGMTGSLTPELPKLLQIIQG